MSEIVGVWRRSAVVEGVEMASCVWACPFQVAAPIERPSCTHVHPMRDPEGGLTVFVPICPHLTSFGVC